MTKPQYGAARALDRFRELLAATSSAEPQWLSTAVLDVDEVHDLSAVAPAVGIAPDALTADERFAVGRGAHELVTVSAHSDEGLFRGLVRCWLDLGGAADRGVDGPRYAYRSLSLDVVRWTMPESVIHSVIDLVALHGFSVLHLHLTDHQGWRAPVPEALPIPGRIDADAYRRLLEHAERRYLTLVPEVDMPGHTAALVAAMPGLANEPPAAHPYLTYLDPRSETVRAAVRTIIDELAALTPGPFLHIGGDEAFSMPDDLYAQFVEFAAQCVRGAGKLPIAWQEVARSEADVAAAITWTSVTDLPAPGSIVAQLPAGAESIGLAIERSFAEAESDAGNLARRGIPVIVAEQDPYYLDRRYVGTSVNPEQDERLEQIGFPAYRPRSIGELWKFDVAAGESARAGAAVVGAECAIWTETVTDIDDLALLLLPRLALVGERSYAGGTSDHADGARRMLGVARPAWAALGFGNDYRDVEWL